MAYTYDATTGRYLRDGTPVPRAEVLLEVDRLYKTTEQRLEEAATRLKLSELQRATNPQKWQKLADKGKAYTIADFQREAKAILKPATMQAALLGGGGKNNADARLYGTAGYQLRQAYARIGTIGKQLENGDLTTAQGLANARNLALNTRQAFHKGELLARAKGGANEGWRRLDPGANHCPDCPTYATDSWIPIGDIVAVGDGCRCGGRCRCSVTYRYNPALNPLSDLADLVLQEQ